jgi:Tol biopolymer transport system component
VCIVLLLAACATDRDVLETTDRTERPVTQKGEEPRREIELDYGRIDLQVTGVEQVEEKPGLFNSYNPQFAGDERYLSFEVNLGNYKKIHIYRLDPLEGPDGYGHAFKKVREVFLDEAFGDELTDELFETSSGESFNYEFSWFPRSSSFIFTSNAGLGEYNLFIGAVEESDSVLKDIRKRLEPRQYGDYFMMTEEIRKDGQAKVSPDGTRIVFTSGRTGNGDLYLFDLESEKLSRLTSSEDTDFFPRWSPDGRDIVYTTGGKQSHDIHVIRRAGTPEEEDEVLVHWFFDDVLPSYSPDGRFISFYTTYNRERDPFNTKRWGIMIIPADGSAPEAGNDLIPYFRVSDVIKDNTQGTAWFPDSTHIVFAKNIDSDYNPVYIYNVEENAERIVDTGTDINHDITVSSHGLISFRAQLFGWDRIFVASTTYYQEYLGELFGGRGK